MRSRCFKNIRPRKTCTEDYSGVFLRAMQCTSAGNDEDKRLQHLQVLVEGYDNSYSLSLPYRDAIVPVAKRTILTTRTTVASFSAASNA